MLEIFYRSFYIDKHVYAQAFRRTGTGSYATDHFLVVVNFTTSIFFL